MFFICKSYLFVDLLEYALHILMWSVDHIYLSLRFNKFTK
jgi:hypothetical protein